MENEDPTARIEPADAVTMQDIAERLRLSVTTVSRSLRREPGINPKTRARVLLAADKMGYRTARSYRTAVLGQEELQNVGVFVATTQFRSSGYVTGMSDASMRLNASLVTHYTKPEHRERILEPEFQPPAMRTGSLSGLILVSRWPEHVVASLAETFPVVSIVHSYPSVNHDTVGLDNHKGVECIVRHLHSLGHRKIGFFGLCTELDYANRRFGAYVSSLRRLRLEYRPEWVIEVDEAQLTDASPNLDGCVNQAAKLVHEGVGAWICATETAGWEFFAALEARGFRIPEDVSIAGFHRPDGLARWGPDLTSISASYEAMGAAALKRLLYRIQNPAEPARMILFAPELYVGKTAAPPFHSFNDLN